jgi:spore coat polysaccharide biosynthesis protein SpsF (cytidylyltransferase family)
MSLLKAKILLYYNRSMLVFIGSKNNVKNNIGFRFEKHPPNCLVIRACGDCEKQPLGYVPFLSSFVERGIDDIKCLLKK